jgi:hypothetical protein
MQPTRDAARHPLVGFLLGLCVLAGVTQLAAGAQPGSIQEQLDPKMQIFWSLFLVVGGLLSLVGIYWPGKNLKVSLELEGLGMIALAIAGVVYAVAIIRIAPLSGMSSWSVILTFALVCIARRQRIENVLRPSVKKRGRHGRA